MKMRAAFLSAFLVALLGCQESVNVQNPANAQVADEFKKEREQMVDAQIRSRGIKDDDVIKAMYRVPRHKFVPPDLEKHAYKDSPLPIGLGQTISQPYIVAYMTDAADLSNDDKVLEIGTGSGYQAAILGEIVKEVYTIEIVPELADRSAKVLTELGYKNVFAKYGNGYLGWPEHAPFDAIIVTAAPDEIPKALVDQLAVGGKMVVPVGTTNQEMVIISKSKNGVTTKRTISVRFVPMTGKPSM